MWFFHYCTAIKSRIANWSSLQKITFFQKKNCDTTPILYLFVVLCKSFQLFVFTGIHLCIESSPVLLLWDLSASVFDSTFLGCFFLTEHHNWIEIFFKSLQILFNLLLKYFSKSENITDCWIYLMTHSQEHGIWYNCLRTKNMPLCTIYALYISIAEMLAVTWSDGSRRERGRGGGGGGRGGGRGRVRGRRGGGGGGGGRRRGPWGGRW